MYACTISQSRSPHTYSSTNLKPDCCRQESRKDIWEIAICREKEHRQQKSSRPLSTTHALTNLLVNGHVESTCKGPILHIGKLTSPLSNQKTESRLRRRGLHYCDWSGWNHQSQTTSLVETWGMMPAVLFCPAALLQATACVASQPNPHSC